jgi:hypothetical protein
MIQINPKLIDWYESNIEKFKIEFTNAKNLTDNYHDSKQFLSMIPSQFVNMLWYERTTP